MDIELSDGERLIFKLTQMVTQLKKDLKDLKDYKLPFDVHIPPATIIRAGVHLEVLLTHLQIREQFSAEEVYERKLDIHMAEDHFVQAIENPGPVTWTGKIVLPDPADPDWSAKVAGAYKAEHAKPDEELSKPKPEMKPNIVNEASLLRAEMAHRTSVQAEHEKDAATHHSMEKAHAEAREAKVAAGTYDATEVSPEVVYREARDRQAREAKAALLGARVRQAKQDMALVLGAEARRVEERDRLAELGKLVPKAKIRYGDAEAERREAIRAKLHAELDKPLPAIAVTEATVDLRTPTKAGVQACPDCNGSGWQKDDTANGRHVCRRCGGTGYVPKPAEGYTVASSGPPKPMGAT